MDLLYEEGKRRGLDRESAIRDQVEDLERRLVIQRLLTEEETAQGATSEREVRGYFEAHRSEFDEPERIHLSRVLVTVLPSATDADRKKARARAEALLKRLRRGEAFAQVALEGDGPERARSGDVGWVTRPEVSDPQLAQAAFALSRVGAQSDVVATRDGLALLSLIDRHPASSPSFEEARSRVLNRIDPVRKRSVFDHLVARLRQGGATTASAADVR